MPLKTQLEDDLHDSMRAKNDQVKDTLRMVLSAIKFQEIESQKELEDREILTILQKEVKIRKETLKELTSSDRDDLIQKANIELSILEKYLPSQLSDDEITLMAKEIIFETSSSNVSDMGKVMKILLPKIAGSATPERISTIVRNLLSL